MNYVSKLQQADGSFVGDKWGKFKHLLGYLENPAELFPVQLKMLFYIIMSCCPSVAFQNGKISCSFM